MYIYTIIFLLPSHSRALASFFILFVSSDPSTSGELRRRSSGVVLPPQISSPFSSFIPHTSLLFFFRKFGPELRWVLLIDSSITLYIDSDVSFSFFSFGFWFFLTVWAIVFRRDNQWRWPPSNLQLHNQARYISFSHLIAIFLWIRVRLRGFEGILGF